MLGLNVGQGKSPDRPSGTRATLKWDFSAIDVPVRLSSVDQDIWVQPGDIIIGDADGIVCLPRSLAERVIDMVPKLVSGFFFFKFLR